LLLLLLTETNRSCRLFVWKSGKGAVSCVCRRGIYSGASQHIVGIRYSFYIPDL